MLDRLVVVEAELVRRLRSAEAEYDVLQVLEDASGDNHGVEEPELLDERDSIVAGMAMTAAMPWRVSYTAANQCSGPDTVGDVAVVVTAKR